MLQSVVLFLFLSHPRAALGLAPFPTSRSRIYNFSAAVQKAPSATSALLRALPRAPPAPAQGPLCLSSLNHQERVRPARSRAGPSRAGPSPGLRTGLSRAQQVPPECSDCSRPELVLPLSSVGTVMRAPRWLELLSLLAGTRVALLLTPPHPGRCLGRQGPCVSRFLSRRPPACVHQTT